MKKLLLIITIMLLPLPSFAWDASGHQLVAQIAYDHLKPEVKRRVNKLVNKLNHDYSKTTFVKSSAWPDVIKGHDVKAFDAWHFVDIPFSPYDMPLPKSEKINAVWAVNQATIIEKSKHSNEFEKAFFLRFLIHIVGDMHQPLHCSTRVTHEHPDGDRGGNLYPIIFPPYNNLHSFWDKGAGYFGKYFNNYPLKPRQVRRLATIIEKDFPETIFGARAWDLDPQSWAKQSSHIARTWVYRTKENKKPNAHYTRRSQQIVERQVALAGYRLAHLLNQLYAG